MFQLKRIIKPCLLRSIYRSYVSSININVDKIKVIKIRPDEFEEHSKNLIKVEMIDGEKNLIKLENHTRITQNDDKFTLECLEDHDADKMKDMSLIIDLPISSCNDIEIKVSAVKGDIKIDNLPTAKKITAITNDGKIKILHLRSGEVLARGSEIFLDTVYAFNIETKARGDDEKALINIVNCQSDVLKVDAPKVRVDSCYSNEVDIKSTIEALLKNLHGNTKFNSSGKVFNTVGFAGTFNGKIHSHKTMLHFAELTGDSSIELSHPDGYIRAGFANEIIKESTNLHIISNCQILTKSREFVVCQKAEDRFEVIRNNDPDSDSTLKMTVTNAKEFQLIKQSWIDSITFDF